MEEVVEESGEGRRRARKWECTKTSPKTQQVWHLGTSLAATAPCHAFLDNSFPCSICLADGVPLYGIV